MIGAGKQTLDVKYVAQAVLAPGIPVAVLGVVVVVGAHPWPLGPCAGVIPSAQHPNRWPQLN